MYFSYATVKITAIRTFRSPNPWNNGQVCDWNLDQYGFAAAITVLGPTAEAPQPPRPGRIKGQALGIQSQPNGRYHILPRSLEELSRDERTPDAELPALLHKMEPALEDLDFRHPMDGLFAFYAYFCGLLLVGSCVLLFAVLGHPSEIKGAVAAIAFFGFLSTVTFGRMARRRYRKQRQITELLFSGTPRC